MLMKHIPIPRGPVAEIVRRMYGGFADFETAVAKEAEKCGTWAPIEAEVAQRPPKVDGLLEVYNGPRVLQPMSQTPQFGGSAASDGASTTLIKVEQHVLDSLGPGRVVEWNTNGLLHRWPRFCTLATCPAGVLPALVETDHAHASALQ